MKDLKAVSLLSFARVTTVDWADSSKSSLELKGTSFKDIEYVLINGIKETDFIVPTSTKLITAIPESLTGKVFESIQVVRRNAESDFSGVYLGVFPESAIEGSSRVIQLFLKLLLTRKGSNIFNPDEGTRLTSYLTSGDPRVAISEVDSSVQEAVAQIQKSQTGQTLHPSEMLQSVLVLSSEFDPVGASINVQLQISTVSGVVRITEVEL